MSSLTIIVPSRDYAGVLQAVRPADSCKVSRRAGSKTWQKIALSCRTGAMTLSSLVRRRRGDRFCKIVLGMHNFFRQVRTRAAANREFLLGRVETTQMFIGIVAEPDFLETDERIDLILAICQKVDGLIFTGHSMLDDHGRLILDVDGKCDYRVKT